MCEKGNTIAWFEIRSDVWPRDEWTTVPEMVSTRDRGEMLKIFNEMKEEYPDAGIQVFYFTSERLDWVK